MGSSAAMESLNRVLEKHGDELVAELREQYPSTLIKNFTLENNLYSLTVTAELQDGTYLTLEPIDIDTLDSRFPDCEVGY